MTIEQNRRNITQRIIGGASALLGILWLLAMVYSGKFWFTTSTPRGEFDYTFMIFYVPVMLLMLIPGILLTRYGFRFFKSATTASLKPIFGAIATITALVMGAWMTRLSGDRFPEHTWLGVFILVPCLVIVPAYVISVRFVMSRVTGEVPGYPELLGRDALLLMALLVWFVLSSLFRAFSPEAIDYDLPWGILSLVIPIAVAAGGYKIAAHHLLKIPNTMEQPSPRDPA